MKIKIKVRDYITKPRRSDRRLPATIELNEMQLFDLLSANGMIAHVWSISDVQEARPDLNDDQAWQVLKDVDANLDSNFGITWESIHMVAEELFGPEPEDDKDSISAGDKQFSDQHRR